MEKASRCIAAGRVTGLQSGKPAKRRSFHGVIADSGKPLPAPEGGVGPGPHPAFVLNAGFPAIARLQTPAVLLRLRCSLIQSRSERWRFMFQPDLLKDRAIFLTGGGNPPSAAPWPCTSPSSGRDSSSIGRREEPLEPAKRFTAMAALLLSPRAMSGNTLPSKLL